MPGRSRPRVHARDHEHGGADPTNIHYEDVGDAGAGGGGIQFDTKPQAGTWLYVETTGVTDGTLDTGIELNAAHDIELITGSDLHVFTGRDMVVSTDRDLAVNTDRDMAVVTIGEVTIYAATNIKLRVDNTGGGGNLILQNLPTTNPGVTGAVWNDSGTLKIA